MNRRTISCALCVAVLAAGVAFNARAASFVTESNIILNPDEVDVSTNSVEYVGGGTHPGKVTVPDIKLRLATGGSSPPTVLESSIGSFFDVFVELSLDGGSGTIKNFQGLGSGQNTVTALSLDTTPDGIPIAQYSTQRTGFIAALYDRTGGVVELRESPSGTGGGGHGGGGGGGTTSTGPRVRESPTLRLAPGPPVYLISRAFFDISTELSTDNGKTWIPASGPVHFESVPEPSTLALELFGIAVVGVTARRLQRREKPGAA